MLYKYIAIEGNIGSGKTTLATMLSDDYDVRLILESFAENPFLPKFYKAPDRHAFPLELFFMAERYHQLKSLKEQDLFRPQMISDYSFVKSKLFAQNNLQHDELQLFNRLFDIMCSSLSKPDLVVYLQAPVNTLLARIKNRGIQAERTIDSDYLEMLNDAYTRFFHFYEQSPLLIVNANEIDWVNNDDSYNQLVEYILTIKQGRHYFNPTSTLL